MHFNAASQSGTRTRRIESHRDRILNGKGIHDCVCGLSKRMPNCDGSHKYA
jgi:CDGSH-type Zn-finger protein